MRFFYLFALIYQLTRSLWNGCLTNSHYTRGGATLTTPFAGLYVSATRVDVIQDAIRILFCDFELDCEKDEDLKEVVIFLESVKDFLKRTLEEEEVWIIFYPISRIIS